MNEETAIAETVVYKALEPIGSKRTLQGLLERQMGALAQVLPRHVTPERLVKTLMVAINRQPDLLQCTQESVLDSVARAAELGLDLSGTLGEAYLVPFNNRIKVDGKEVWRKQALFIPGYRGLAKLARQSGEVKRIEAQVIYEKDMETRPDGEPGFVYEKGLEFRLLYRPYLGEDRGKAVGAYALVEFKDGGIQADFMTRGDIERVRKMSKAKDGPAWSGHWDEMAKKTVFRRLAKWLPLSGEKWNLALVTDNEVEFDLGAMADAALDPSDFQDVVDVTVEAPEVSPPETPRVAKALAKAKISEDELRGFVSEVKGVSLDMMAETAVLAAIEELAAVKGAEA